MENIIIQITRYLLILLFGLYTLYCFTVFRRKNKENQNRVFQKQRRLIYFIHFICSFILLLNTKNVKIIMLYLIQLLFLVISIKVYEYFYQGLSKLILNNMMMLLVIGFIMLERLSFDLAVKQFMIASSVVILCLFIPFLIERFKYFDCLGWYYAIIGIGLLVLVFIIGVEKYGAKNWIQIGGFMFQPSEFVKVIFVLFIASMLAKSTKFYDVVKVTIVAAIHVLILVIEKDLGAAIIYFLTYLMVLYVASHKPIYLFSGLLAGSVAAFFAYHFFSHVQVRVMAWDNPWAVIDKQGYQIAQSLFAIGTGGWFGLGLSKGMPTTIPVYYSDFVFSAIVEELGGVFSICLLLVYLSCFIMFINIAMKIKRDFYKLTAFGLSVMFIFQVFLSVGGVTKFIPSTGVTLPLISYGGSSVISTVIVFSIIQGMYVLNENEVIVDEKEKGADSNRRKKRKKDEENREEEEGEV